ncbi:amino acid permease [Candidatus Aerophobetes bacterium]|uniref:Amino acid permease n=1 Tax=Aerophobetes bacterium TaxID=2030807 RepID=A0A2A4X409_UNCAE|nr:MAG: amino acid permease [Candidatus Aerophobetes bacterium]
MSGHEKKQIGFWVLTALVFGNMVGSGVFLLPSALAFFGTISLLSWGFTAVGAILLALVFARMSSLFPKSGGPYVFCREAYGDFIGFQVAYSYWVYIWTGNAAIAVAFTGYLTAFVPYLNAHPFLTFAVTASAVWILTLINLIGVRFAGVVQLVLSIIKFVPIAFLAIVGLFYVDTANFNYFNVSDTSNFSAFTGAALLTLWAFLGLESASIPADNVKDPVKNIPKATIVGTLLAASLYIVITVAIMGVIPIPQLQQSLAPFADFAEIVLGPVGKIVIGITAMIACLSALNGWILLQGQIPLAAAKDKLFPKAFTRVNKAGVPVFGMIVSSLLITLVLFLNEGKNLVEQFTFIISIATLSALMTYLYTSITEFVIGRRAKPGHISRSDYKHLIIALLAFVYAFWAFMGAGKDIFYWGIGFLFTSLPIYGIMCLKKETSKSKAL